MVAAKRRRLKISCVQDVIDLEGYTSYLVTNERGDILWRQSNAMIQKYDREVLTGLTQRWINDEGCRRLNTRNVELRDNVVVLPEARPKDSTDFPKLFDDYIVEVHGTAAVFRARDDFLLKLRKPKISLIEFKNLFFHPFLQGVEELSDFPARVVENIKFLKVLYYGEFSRWDIAYSDWEGDMHKRDIDLIETCMVDLLVLRVYIRGNYTNDPANEALLVRNIIVHLNEWKLKRDRVIFTKEEIAEIIYELFPDISFKLFDFCQFCVIDLNFTKQCRFLKASNSDFAVLPSQS